LEHSIALVTTSSESIIAEFSKNIDLAGGGALPRVAVRCETGMWLEQSGLRKVFYLHLTDARPSPYSTRVPRKIFLKT
jgi:hypothetical protein